MEHREVVSGREFVGRLEHGRDWRGRIEEFAARVGNVSALDGEPFEYTHAVLTGEDGTTLGGHLDAATTLAGELWLREFDIRLEPESDEFTELALRPL